MLDIPQLIKWTNDNSGFVSILIFIATLLFGWFSGIFGALRKKPKFIIEVLPGPSLCSTYMTGKKQDEYDAHITAFSLYLKITNIGSSPSNIDKVYLGYHWNIGVYNWNWIKYRIGWAWLEKATIVKEDFTIDIDGDNRKVYPFLFQKSILLNYQTDTYLNIGQNAVGMIYFEQHESLGAASPLVEEKSTEIKIKVFDSFGNAHSLVTKIPVVDIVEARKFNLHFGEIYPSIQASQANKL